LFNGDDRPDTTPVAVVNKTFAKRYLTGRNPIGVQFSAGYPAPNPQLEVTVVGVIDDIRQKNLGEEAEPAFYTPTGYGTLIAEGKETREFNGRMYVMERGLTADFAFIKAWKGDTLGNLLYRKTARNFNPMMATAARVAIAEVEQVVQPGEIDPDAVHTPAIFIQRILQGPQYEKRIEKRTVRKATS